MKTSKYIFKMITASLAAILILGASSGLSLFHPNHTVRAAAVEEFTTDSEEGIGGFVDRLYLLSLGRAADTEGRDYWVSALSSHKITGTQAANDMFNCPEFASRNLTDEQFVMTLYKVFFDRTPDEIGFYNWLFALENGTSRAEVISGFTESSEWSNICTGYGIKA